VWLNATKGGSLVFTAKRERATHLVILLDTASDIACS
jgi:hypothetical protein